MKWLRLLILSIFLFFVLECFFKFPFSKELPMFILPEINLNTSIVRADDSKLGAITDIRPDYIQTEYNFSSYHNEALDYKEQFLSAFENEVVHAGKILVNRQPLLDYKKTKINKPVVWPRKFLSPIKTSSAKLMKLSDFSNDLLQN